MSRPCLLYTSGQRPARIRCVGILALQEDGVARLEVGGIRQIRHNVDIRQRLDCDGAVRSSLKRGKAFVYLAVCTEGERPVSYTHLDVYKRQAQGFAVAVALAAENAVGEFLCLALDVGLNGRSSIHQFMKNSTMPERKAAYILFHVIFWFFTPFVPRHESARNMTATSFSLRQVTRLK